MRMPSGPIIDKWSAGQNNAHAVMTFSSNVVIGQKKFRQTAQTTKSPNQCLVLYWMFRLSQASDAFRFWRTDYDRKDDLENIISYSAFTYFNFLTGPNDTHHFWWVGKFLVHQTLLQSFRKWSRLLQSGLQQMTVIHFLIVQDSGMAKLFWP